MLKYLVVLAALLVTKPALAVAGETEVGFMNGESVLVTPYNRSKKQYAAAVRASNKLAKELSDADGKHPRIKECQDLRKKHVVCPLTLLLFEVDSTLKRTLEFMGSDIASAEARIEKEYKGALSPIPGPCRALKSSVQCDLIYLEMGEYEPEYAN